MKKFAIIVMVLCLAISSSYAQKEEKAKSSTQSALCTAQSKVFTQIFDSVYTIENKIDVNKSYKEAITTEIIKCLEADLTLWGESVIADAKNGEFNRYAISFEKPEKNTFEVPRKAQKFYTKAFNKARQDFIAGRKTKTLDEMFAKDYLKKYISKVVDAFVAQKDSYLKTISK
ncbi:MAG: hypothetical protein NT085_05410 [candidate division SR1 bacterium]|nr:hypothetical protein [candidate division SR1 bacterium]